MLQMLQNVAKMLQKCWKILLQFCKLLLQNVAKGNCKWFKNLQNVAKCCKNVVTCCAHATCWKMLQKCYKMLQNVSTQDTHSDTFQVWAMRLLLHKGWYSEEAQTHTLEKSLLYGSSANILLVASMSWSTTCFHIQGRNLLPAT